MFPLLSHSDELQSQNKINLTSLNHTPGFKLKHVLKLGALCAPLDYDVKSLFVQEITVFPFLRGHPSNIAIAPTSLFEMRNSALSSAHSVLSFRRAASYAVSRATSRGLAGMGA